MFASVASLLKQAKRYGGNCWCWSLIARAAEEEREANLGDGEASLCRDLRSADPPSPAMEPPEPEEPGMLQSITDFVGITGDD